MADPGSRVGRVWDSIGLRVLGVLGVLESRVRN